MTRAEGVRVEGLRVAVRRLEALGIDAADLKEAFADISREVVSEASALVPARTGRLRGTIRPGLTKNKAIVRAGTKAAPYAGVINYGWPTRTIAPTGFLTTPANSNPEAKVARIEDNLERLIRLHNLH